MFKPIRTKYKLFFIFMYGTKKTTPIESFLSPFLSVYHGIFMLWIVIICSKQQSGNRLVAKATGHYEIRTFKG